jgi:hypothetical protein
LEPSGEREKQIELSGEKSYGKRWKEGRGKEKEKKKKEKRKRKKERKGKDKTEIRKINEIRICSNKRKDVS